MEGVGDVCFRKAIATVGGFDEAVREFLRVPRCAHIPSLAQEYVAKELGSIPLAAQLMGSDLELMAQMAQEIEKRGAPRIDINCGCPSNTVTGKGAGSSLLKEPNFLHEVARAVVRAVKIPVTLKMRSGYEDTSLFKENLLAAESSGIAYLTLHPRTKVEGYGPPAKWELIAEAKALLKIPVVGNGDILNVEDARRMLAFTRCDALMIGRGSVINPFIFHQIRASFSGVAYAVKGGVLDLYFKTYLNEIFPDAPEKNKIGKLKQLMGFFFKGNSSLLAKRQEMLTGSYANLDDFLERTLPLLRKTFH